MAQPPGVTGASWACSGVSRECGGTGFGDRVVSAPVPARDADPADDSGADRQRQAAAV